MPSARQVLDNAPSTEQRLTRTEFDLTNATANQRSKIAEVQAQVPLEVREDPMRLMFVTEEDFTTDGTGGNSETFNLSNNLIDTANTTSLVLFEAGTRVQPDSVDHANNAFDYTDDGTSNDLHVYYVCRDPVQVSIEKHAPTGQGNVSEVLYDDVTSVLHERNQNKEPVIPSMNRSPLQPVVPTNWTIEVYADGAVPIEWTESTDSTTAPNPVLHIPIERYANTVEGLSRAVKQDIVDRV